MGALFYMMRKRLKNSLLELLHHPGRLVAYLFVLGMLLFSGLTNMRAPAGPDAYTDIRLLEGIYLGLLLLITVPSLLVGLRSGANLFTLSDVNNLFISPVSPRKILLYGLLRQMGASLLMMVFFFSYAGMAVRSFGLTPLMAVLLIAGFAVTVFLVQLLTMLIYSFSNGSPARIRGVKTVLILLVGAALAAVGVPLLQNGLGPDSLYAAVSQPLLEWIPFVGWMKGLLFSLWEGRTLWAAGFGGLLLGGTAGVVALFLHIEPDYYEDVLQNAETTYEIRAAAKEGRVTNAGGGREIKVRDTGIGRGWGASAFFFKHLREMRRRSRLVFVGGSTLLQLAGGVILALVLRFAGGGEMSPGMVMIMVTTMCLYILLFTNSAGEWGRELAKPYLYLVPAGPFAKLLWASLTSLIKPLVDGVVIFLGVGIAAGARPFTTVMCMLLYASFGALFTAANILSQRLFGKAGNQGLLLFLYVLMLMILVLPGLAGGITLGVLMDMGILPGAPCTTWRPSEVFSIHLGGMQSWLKSVPSAPCVSHPRPATCGSSSARPTTSFPNPSGCPISNGTRTISSVWSCPGTGRTPTPRRGGPCGSGWSRASCGRTSSRRSIAMKSRLICRE